MKKETTYLKKVFKNDYEFLQHLLDTDYYVPNLESKYEYILSICNDMTVKWNSYYNKSTTPTQKSICRSMFNIIDKASYEALEIIKYNVLKYINYHY